MRRLVVLVLAGLAWVRLAPAQPFLADDPLREDPDRMEAPAPEFRALSDYFDFLAGTLSDQGTYDGPALNVNTLGEVPNSSWYTNRHYFYPMTTEQVVRGPNIVDGPSMEGPWQVVDGKQEGATLGLQIVDAHGDRYVLKFDPMRFPEMSSAAEVISTKFFHALGYNVPQNFIVHFQADHLVPGDEATYEGPGGEELPITQDYIDELLAFAPRRDDGLYRAMASKFLDGTPVGPFELHGIRPDDANDIYPHEGRRELRGLRVFSAWLHHNDMRSPNSLDMFIDEDGDELGYVRHHLIDFGSTLGASPVGPVRHWVGHEYVVEGGSILARTLTFGFGNSGWVDIDYEHEEGGRLESAHFDPEKWKPRYPLASFRRMDADDAFWAARQVMAFDDETIRAVVVTGRHSDPAVARHLAEQLIARRDKIGQAYLNHGGGLDRFRVEDGRLVFVDLRSTYGLSDTLPTRTVTWRPYDNAADRLGEPLHEEEIDSTFAPIPSFDADYLTATITTPRQGTTRVYLRRIGDTYATVGIRRSEAH